MPSSLEQLTERVKQRATECGFDLVGIAPAVTPTGYSSFLEWIDAGYAGEMQYIPNRAKAYEHPKHVLESVKSVIMVGFNYFTEPAIPGSTSEDRDGLGRIARYAWGTADYHDVLRKRLKQLAAVLHDEIPDCKTRAVIDTAPLLERDFAQLAGLGWIGKNTLLLNKQKGSWFFLGALLTNIELPADAPHETAHCGTCTRCLDVCPTDAFPESGILDARKCISYLTIELRDQPIPKELRTGVEDWLFGCDLCQDVCPWNSKATASEEPEFQPRKQLNPTDAARLLSLDDEQFRAEFRKTPLDRPGRAGLLRTACIVLGNVGGRRHLPQLDQSLSDKEPLIRGAAAWGIGQLGGVNEIAELQSRLQTEDNEIVRQELQSAIQHLEETHDADSH
ncbi:MAG: tRNA epoxyqueuosine(34) reductase QueG [Planctomycetaceae bacterium]|nr:tRNA epoxyqueuosine(34) reductase QueG [Planctomycetaceae bacterium]